MESETYKTITAVDAVSSYDNSCLIDGFDLSAESFLNDDNTASLYPSPPVEPGLEPIQTMPSTNHTSTISNTTDDKDVVVSVSTSFNPASHSTRSDLIFNTSDLVLFYAHSQVLKASSWKAFSRVLWSQNGRNHTNHVMVGSDIIHGVPDSSAVFNVILHTLYGTSPAQNSPSFETLMIAVDRMPFYDIDPKDFITRKTPVYQLLLSHAPLYPLQLYSLAGRHGLEDLAVSSSSHLLSFPISTLRDEMAAQMGATYLKRLFCLHFNRVNALKQILLAPPHPHPPTNECDFEQQKALTRAWALVSAHLAWDARPDLSTYSIRKSFQSLTENLTCEMCQAELEKRIKEAVDQWAGVKTTI